jgi:hypothetical protein
VAVAIVAATSSRCSKMNTWFTTWPSLSSQPLPHSKLFVAMSDEEQIVKLQELFA